jgi:hypothetical protein
MAYKMKGWTGWIEKIPVIGSKIKKIKAANIKYKANKEKK